MANPDSRSFSSATGLLQSLKHYLRTWVELLRTRVDLFSTELQEERERVQAVVLWGVVSLLLLCFGILLATLFVVVLFWDTNYRLAVLGGIALFYLAAGVGVGLVARRKSRQKPRLFSATLSELAKDCQHLSSSL